MTQTEAFGEEPEPGSCAALSAHRSMIGTCDSVDVWLFVEVPGAWPAKPLDVATLPGSMKDHLQRLVQSAQADHELKVRLQLVKQARVEGQRVMLLLRDRLWVLPGGRSSLTTLTATDLAGLYGESLVTAPTAERSESGLQALREPQYFVCTHGQRDRCCGALGMPLYRALTERVQQRAWQVSHLGGHRFAPNVLVTPGGLLYGRVLESSMSRFLGTVEAGGIDFALLRGRSSYPAHVQAAEALLARSDLRLLHVDGDRRRARVTFASPDATHEIDIGQAEVPEQVLASCGASELKPYSPFAARS